MSDALDAKQDLIDADNKLAMNLVDGLSDALDAKQDLIDADNKLAMNLVDGLSDALDAKQDLIDADNKLSMDLVDGLSDALDGKAGLASNNVFSGSNTFGATEGSQVVIGTDGTLKVDGTATLKTLKFAGTNTVNAIDAGDAESFSEETDGSTLATLASINQLAEQALYTGTKVNVKEDTTTISGAIADLDAIIGDVSTLDGNALNNGGEDQPATVVEALTNINDTLGTIHGLKANGSHLGEDSNLADGTTVEKHLVSLDDAIGNRNYTSTNYVEAGSDLATAVSTLDENVGRIDDNLSRLNGQMGDLYNRTNKMHHEMKSGFASLAALTGLVPDSRSAGDTQISLGTGYYRGTTGFALGAFHHLNDNVLLNVGAAYAGNGSATFKGGVTFGF